MLQSASCTAIMNELKSVPKSIQDMSNFKGFKIVHLNVRSLLKKMDRIRLVTEGSEVDVITLSETWLKPHLNTSLVGIDGYQAFCQDRNLLTKKKKGKKGGGLISYVSTRHASSCEPLEELDIVSEHIEAQWLYFHRQHCRCTKYNDMRRSIY